MMHFEKILTYLQNCGLNLYFMNQYDIKMKPSTSLYVLFGKWFKYLFMS